MKNLILFTTLLILCQKSYCITPSATQVSFGENINFSTTCFNDALDDYVIWEYDKQILKLNYYESKRYWETAHFLVIKNRTGKTTIKAKLYDKKHNLLNEASIDIMVISKYHTMTTSGNFNVFEKINLDISPKINLPSDIPYSVTWTDSEGERVTIQGKTSYQKIFKSTGNHTIDGKVKYSINGQEEEIVVVKSFYVDNPTESTLSSIEINGENRIQLKENNTTRLFHLSSSAYDVNHYYMSYEWEILHHSVTNPAIITYSGKTGIYLNFPYDSRITSNGESLPCNYMIKCQPVYTYQGRSVKGSVISKLLTVTCIATRSYQIINSHNTIFISENIDNQNLLITKSSSNITYQLNNILTGNLAAKGITTGNGTINTSNIPKGIYVLTLTNSEGESTSEKIVIK